MPALSNQPGDSGERHLTAHGKDQGLEQQREAGELSRPAGLDQDHPAIGKLEPWRAYFEIAFMLEKVEMAVALRLGIVNRVQPLRALIGESGCPS